MPTVKKSLAMRPVLDEDQLEYFRSGTDFAVFWDEPQRGQDWQSVMEDILAGWIRDHPGTRPFAWWRYDAPGPRLRVGGRGDLVPAYDHPTNLRFGIPRRSSFVDVGLLQSWRTIGCTSGLARQAIDPGNPPRFESQASYLRRHKLFLPGEEKRIPADAFVPEAVR